MEVSRPEVVWNIDIILFPNNSYLFALQLYQPALPHEIIGDIVPHQIWSRRRV